jgi:hypothetical protein
MVSWLSDYFLESGMLPMRYEIPLSTCFYAVSETLLTALLLVAWIEVLKDYKRADYEGRPLPDLEQTFPEAVKNLFTMIAQMIWGDRTGIVSA